MGRTDLLLALGNQDKIDRQFHIGGAEGMQRRQHCGFRPLLVDRAAPNDNFAKAGLVDDLPVERRVVPFGRIVLLDVVHEIEPDGALGARIKRGEDPRLAAGRHHFGMLESGVERQLGHMVCALLDIAALRRD